MFWTPTGGTEMVSSSRVDNDAWHHVVLSVNVDRQDLYLDGVPIGQIVGFPIHHLDMTKDLVGTGYTSAQWWPSAGTGYFPFTGRIDDVAVYRHPLSPLRVASHYNAATVATSRLTKTIEPGAFTAVQNTYDQGTPRISTTADRQGAVWNVTQPTLETGTRVVTVSSSGRDAVTYRFDANRGGRLVSRRQVM